MDGSRKRPLNEEEIHELIFLPDGDISDIHLDSDPDDPDCDPRQEPRYADLTPLEAVTDIHDEHPQEEADTQTMNSLADSLLPASRCNGAREKKSKKQKFTRVWKKMDLNAQDTAWRGELPPPPNDVYSAYEYLCTFFNAQMVDILCYQTNLYSTQKNGTCANVSREEMRKYLSIFLISGIVKTPHFHMFWQNGTRFAAVADLMTRNRFETIHSSLHMNDNLQAKPRNTDGHDRLFKVRPLVDQLRRNMKIVAPEEKQSIDEQIIPFKGRSHMKQYLKSKPHKGGYKVFTRASSSGTAEDHGFSISGDIVCDLLKDLPAHQNYKVFFDSWFTSLRLVEDLKTKGILAVGTVRADRTEECPLALDTVLKDLGRGSADFLMDGATGTEVIKWLDNSSALLISSYAGVHPTDTCKRWSNKEKRSVEVARPFAVKEYNSFMGGVDLSDMLIDLYRTDYKFKKRYMRIFFWIIGVSVVNAWLLYKRHCEQLSIKRKLSLLVFRSGIAQALALVQAKAVKWR